MDNSVKSIGIAAVISIAGIALLRELPQHLLQFNNSEWLLVALGSLAITVYLLTNTYLMSRHIATGIKPE